MIRKWLHALAHKLGLNRGRMTRFQDAEGIWQDYWICSGCGAVVPFGPTIGRQPGMPLDAYQDLHDIPREKGGFK